MKKIILLLLLVCLIAIGGIVLYHYNFIPHKKHTQQSFHISTYVSKVDKDEDGVDDQTDLFQSVRAYLDTKPKYKSKYYASGYPDDIYGVCTDVVAFGMRGAGYDIRELMDEDIKQAPEAYNIENPDKNIDFRRVPNMAVYLKRHAIALTKDTGKVEEWQAGDIVVWKNHVGVISDVRNKDGVPFVLHNASPVQPDYEQDILKSWGKIIGHYRIS